MPNVMRNPTTPRLSFARPYTGRRLPERGDGRIMGENQTAQSGAWNAIPEPDGRSASTGKAAAMNHSILSSFWGQSHAANNRIPRHLAVHQ